MGANKQINKIKLQNYAYEVGEGENGVSSVILPGTGGSNVFFQPLAQVNDEYIAVPGYGGYPLIEAIDIVWAPYTVNGHKIMTSYDLISYVGSTYWRQAYTASSIQITAAYNTVIGQFSLAEGSYNYAYGSYSHVEGYGNTAYNAYEHAEGHYNVSHKYDGKTYTNSGNTIFSIGNGDYKGELYRENIIEIRDNNKIYINGVGNYEKGIYNDHVYSLQYELNNLKQAKPDIFYDYGNWQKRLFHWQANCVFCSRSILGRSRHNKTNRSIYLQVSEILDQDERYTNSYTKHFKIYKEALFNLEEKSDYIHIHAFFNMPCNVYINGNIYRTDISYDDIIGESTTNWNNWFQNREYIEITLEFDYHHMNDGFSLSPYLYKSYNLDAETGVYHFYSRKSEHGNYYLWHYKPIYDQKIYVKYHKHILINDVNGTVLGTYRYDRKINDLDKTSPGITLPSLLINQSHKLYVWRAKRGIKWYKRNRHSKLMKWIKIDNSRTLMSWLGIMSAEMYYGSIRLRYDTPTLSNYTRSFLNGLHRIGLEELKIIDNRHIKGTIYLRILVEKDNILYEHIIKRFFDSSDASKNSVRLTMTGKIYTFDELGLKIPM